MGLAVLSLLALVRLWPVLVLVITAFIFMAALLPYVEWLCRRRIPRVGAVLIVLFAILLAIGSMIAIVVPAVVDEFRDLQRNLPDDARQLEDFMSSLGFDTEDWDLPEQAADIQWGDLVSGSAAVDYGQRVLLGVVSGFTVLVVTAYLLVDAPRLKRYLYRFVPPGREPDFEHFIHALGRVVGGYVRGQLITSAIIGVYTMIVLFAVGVPNAVAFGVLAAIADVIPLIGALIAVIPPALAAFQESPTKALVVLGALLLYQQFEDRILVPRIYGQTLNLPAIIVLLAVLIGGELLGVAGILLALPAAAAGRVVLDYYLDQRLPIPPDTTQEVLAPDDRPGSVPAAGS